MKNDNLKSYICDYTIEYNIQVNPTTKAQIRTKRQEQIICEPKDKEEVSQLLYDNERRIKDKMMYGKVHTWLNFYQDYEYEDNVKTKLIDTKIREVSRQNYDDVIRINQIMMIDDDGVKQEDETDTEIRMLEDEIKKEISQ